MMNQNIIRLPYRHKKDLISSFLRGRNQQTADSYRRDVEDFRAFLVVVDIEAAANILLSDGPGPANSLIMDYRSALIDRGLSPATINRRLSTLRSLIRLARTLGLITWALQVDNVRSKSYRDTRGPGLSGFRKLLEVAGKPEGIKSVRDVAILHLLFDMALRRGEVVQLDMTDVDLTAGHLSIIGKGRTEREALTLPTETRATLIAWIEIRGKYPGPLFYNLRPGQRARLTGDGLYKIVRGLGELTGIKTRPHGLRHAAITQALDITNGDLRGVARFSRHKRLETLGHYDDNRRDLAGKISQMVALSVNY